MFIKCVNGKSQIPQPDRCTMRTKTMMNTKSCKPMTLRALATMLLSLLIASTATVSTAEVEDKSGSKSVGVDGIFGNVTNLGTLVNSSQMQYDPSISADGLELYFISYRPGGLGQADIWVTTRETKAAPWGKPVNLGPTINCTEEDNAPDISADGLSLYFASTRSGGYGGRDLWVANRKTKSDPWGKPVNLGPTVNNPADEHGPSISSDGLSLYFSGLWDDPNRPDGFGKADIWLATRKTITDPWDKLVNLGATVNSSSADESPSITEDGLSLYFNSNRPGGQGVDIWVTRRKTKSDPWGTPVNVGQPVSGLGWQANPDISEDGSTLYFVHATRNSRSVDVCMAPLRKSGAK